jgi:hypothetical protein
VSRSSSGARSSSAASGHPSKERQLLGDLKAEVANAQDLRSEANRLLYGSTSVYDLGPEVIDVVDR